MKNEFGKYLKELRHSRNPHVTQEELAKAIGRVKMTISQFEQGKNAPPQGELLDKMINALKLSEEEETKLRYLAAESRHTMPSDIEEYFYNNPNICKIIRAAKLANYDNGDWEKMILLINSK